MAVEINIDLDSSAAHGKIEALETHLKSLNDDLNIDFDVDDDLKDKIDEITKQLDEINIDVDYSDLEKAAALKAMLQGDIEADLDVDTDKALSEIQESLDPGGVDLVDHDRQAGKFSDQGDDSGRFARFKNRFEKLLENTRMQDGGFAPSGFKRDFINQNKESPYSRWNAPSGRNQRMQDLIRGRKNKDYTINYDFDAPDLGGSKGSGGGLSAGRRGTLVGNTKKKMKGIIPDMNTFYRAFAAILPILYTMGTQLAGVAASMGSVAVAGGSILALGLVGHGEDMASSWKKAKEQLSTLKEEMFEVFQPTMQTFAPIQAKFFDVLPKELSEVATAMESLTVYSDTLFASLDGLTDWIADGVRGMTQYESIISQLTLRFGELLGSSIADFFQFIITEAYESQEMMVKFGTAISNLAVALYRIAKTITRVVFALNPVIGVLEYLSGLLDNKIVVGVLTFATVLGLVIYTVFALTTAIAALSTLWAGGFLTTISSSIVALQSWVASAITAKLAAYGLSTGIATAVSWLTLGVGAALAMGAAMKAIDGINAQMERSTNLTTSHRGMPSGGGGYGGGGAGSGTTQTVINEGDTYNVDVSGDVDNPTEQGMKDIFSTESGISDSRETPSPGA
jgi:hypothetical protein